MSLEDKIIRETEDLIGILKEAKLRENLEKYELVKQQGYNMLESQTRILTGLSQEEYTNIVKNYSQLMTKFTDTKDRIHQRLKYIKSANIAKMIAIKGCDKCIEIVSKKLDISLNDICQNCRNALTENQLI